MNGDPAFLSLEQVEELHRLALERHGGQDGIRNAACLESAVMHPLNVWFYARGDFFDVAAAYAFHIAQSQAFLDGNKRTAIAAALTFLEANNVAVPQATAELYDALIGIAERRVTKADLAGILRRLGG